MCVLQAILCSAFTSEGEVAVGGDNGNVYFFDWEGVLKRKVAAHDAAVTAIVSAEVGAAQYVTGGFDGQVKLWSSKFEAVDEVSLCTNETVLAGAVMGQDVKGVRGCVKALDCVDGRLAVGTKDNEVYVVEIGSKEVSLVSQGHCGELWGMAMHPTEAICVTAGDDKVLRCWDMATKEVVRGKVLGLPYSARSVVMSPDGKQIAVGFKDGGAGGSVPVRIVEYETMNVVAELEECEEYVSSLKYSPNGQYFAVGSWDQKLYLYDAAAEYKLMYVLSGNSSSVEHVMFSADSDIVMTNSKDTQMLYWEVATGARITKTSMVRDVAWAPWTGTLGWSVMGIWDPDYDQTDVNAVCQSAEGSAVVFGDDYGKVKLMRYPAAVEGTAACAAYKGHSSHVTCVRFSHDDSRVVSTGGGDTGVFQWQFMKGVAPLAGDIIEEVPGL